MFFVRITNKKFCFGFKKIDSKYDLFANASYNQFENLITSYNQKKAS